MKIKITILVLAILCLFMSGCGGGSGTASVVPQTVSPAAETASLEFQVPWPKDGEDISAQVIQPEVVKIQVKITGDTISTPIIIILNKGETTKVITDVPAGNLQIEFTGLDASGNVLSSRITNVTVTAGQTLPVSVILGVSILSDGFFPSTITLYKGDTLVFVNNDGVTHSFSVPELFNSGDVLAGGSFSYTFGNTSLYTYTCTREDGKILIIIIKDGYDSTQPTAYPLREIFVDYLNGSDDPNAADGTISKPYKSIDKGVEVANRDYTVGKINLRAPDNDNREINASSPSLDSYDPNTSLTLRNNLILRKYPYDENECIIDFSGINPSTEGAGFILSGNDTIQGLIIGGVIGGSGIKVSGNDCTIDKCIITENGIEMLGKISASGAFTEFNGGGINIDRGNCNIINCFIYNNYAMGEIYPKKAQNTDNAYSDLPLYGYGGGLFVNTGATCHVNNSTFIGNSAFLGGAIACFGTCTVTGSTDWYDRNKSYEQNINDNNIKDKANSKAICMPVPALFYYNNAICGGGAIANKGHINIHAVIILNYSDPDYYTDRTQYIEENTEILSGGGGIVNIGTCNIRGSIIAGNCSESSKNMNPRGANTSNGKEFYISGCGGGICNTYYPNQTGVCTISENTLIIKNESDTGGGLYNAGICTITDTAVIENLASSSGGGITNDFIELAENNIIMGSCIMNRVIIEGNQAEDEGNGNGGGICNLASLALNSQVMIKNNMAYNYGGGLYMNEAGSVKFGSSPGVIEGNHADCKDSTSGIGGGIYDHEQTIPLPLPVWIFGTGNYKGSGTTTVDNINGNP